MSNLTASHWQAIRLKFLGRFKGGAGFPHDEQGNSTGEIPFFKVKALSGVDTDGAMRATDDYISRETASKLGAFIFPERSIVFAKVGAALLLNRFSLLGQQSCIDNNMMGFVVNERKAYLPFALKALSLIDFATLVNPGPVPSLNEGQISNETIFLPYEAEQRRVAAYLDEQTTKIDRLMKMRRQQMTLLKEQRAALIQQAITRGLNPNAQMKDSGLHQLGEVPAHWEVKEIRYLVPRNRQVMYGIVLPGPNVDEGVPIVKAGNCEPGRLSIECMHRTTFEIEAGYVRSRLRAGDIVYAIRGSFGEAEIVPPELEGANLTQDAARIAPKPDINNRWLWYAVRSQAFFAQMDSVAVGATIRGVNIRDLKRGKLAVPPISEQKQIANFIDSESERFDTIYAAYARQLTLLAEYRAALIHECVTGQQRVGEDLTLERL